MTGDAADEVRPLSISAGAGGSPGRSGGGVYKPMPMLLLDRPLSFALCADGGAARQIREIKTQVTSTVKVFLEYMLPSQTNETATWTLTVGMIAIADQFTDKPAFRANTFGNKRRAGGKVRRLLPGRGLLPKNQEARTG